jgi:hypothetical protein
MQNRTLKSISDVIPKYRSNPITIKFKVLLFFLVKIYPAAKWHTIHKFANL